MGGQERNDDLLGSVLGGAYRVRSRIGKGGMGSVYVADHVRLPKSFAVKVLNEAVDPASELYHRFRREAEVCSRLKHEHIVEVVDFNLTEDGRPYIVMELLEGEDLGTRLDRIGRLSLTGAARILGQVAEALAEAHEQGVVHRDMKPANIFLCRRRHQDDFVKLVDFGISKIQGAGSLLTGTNALMGTPFYMSPEQTGAGDARVDHRTDIYALGVIAYQMLTGTVPFGGDNFAQLVLSIISKPPDSVTALVPGLPAAVDLVVHCAMAKDPRERFQVVAEFDRAFQALTLGASDANPPAGFPGGSTPPGSVSAPVQGAVTPSGSYPGTLSYPPSGAGQPGSYPPSGAGQPGSYPPSGAGQPGSYPPSGAGQAGSYPPVGAGQPGSWPPGGSSSATSDAPPHPASGAELGSAPTTLSGTTGEHDGLHLPRERRGPSRALLLGMGVVALAAVLALVVIGAGGGKKRGDHADPSSKPAAATTDPAGDMDATSSSRDSASPRAGDNRSVGLAASRVVVRLAGLPSDAKCRVDGRPREGNPLVLERSERPVTLHCDAPGRSTFTSMLTPDKDSEVQVSMPIDPARAAVSASGHKPRRPRPALGSMTPSRPRPERPSPPQRPMRPTVDDVPID